MMDKKNRLEELKLYIRTQKWRGQPGKPIQHGQQIVVTDGTHQVPVNFYPKRGRLVIGGSASPLKMALEAWKSGKPMAVKPDDSNIFGETRLDALKAFVKEQDWNWGPGADIPHGKQIVVSDAGVTALVNFWPKKGKLQVQGRDSSLKHVLQNWVMSKSDTTAHPKEMITQAHIGLDETGKGDWFGPLVVAAVYVDEALATALRQMGVRDSKVLAPTNIQYLADQIEYIIPETKRYVWVIEPKLYNRLYSEHNNINLLLADVYAQVAKQVWSACQTQTIVCDQFSQRTDRLEQTFLAVDLPQPRQQHHAESASVAVAAASILASAAFSQALTRLGVAAGLDGPLPKGSSDEEKLTAAVEHIRIDQGPEALGSYAKLHFRPIRRLLGQDAAPEKAQTQAQARLGPLVTIEQPAWQMQYHPTGYWRYSFVDGGYLDWYEGSAKGTIYVHGKADAESVKILKPKTDGKGWHGEHEAITQAVEKYIPSLQKQQVPSALGIGWYCKSTVFGLRFNFTDGGILHYYAGTDTLLIQGTPSPVTEQALEALISPFWSGPNVLLDNLKLLFPDWQSHPDHSLDAERKALSLAQLEWEPGENALNWRAMWPSHRQMRLATNKKAPCQKELTEDWASILERHQGKRHLLAHAPTGLGKTLASLVSALAWVAQAPGQRRVYYLVNRITQHENPIRELKNSLAAAFSSQSGQSLRVVDIVGRNLLCHHPQARRLPDSCKRSRDEATFDWLPQDVLTWHEVKTSLDRQTCPYHALQGLMPQAHVVICDYWWLFSEMAQESSWMKKAGFSANNTILIVDEAHNLPLRVRSELDVDETAAKIEDELARAPANVQACLEPLIAAIQQTNPEQGISPSALCSISGGSEVIRQALTTFTEDEFTKAPNAIPERILRLLLKSNDEVVIYPTQDLDNQLRLVFRLVDPTPVLCAGYNQVYASLSMSGTLAAPADNSEELRYQVPLFGLPQHETLTRKYASPFPRRHQRWIYSTDTYGTYRYRNNYLGQYAEHIVNIGQVTPGVTAVFFSSYAFLTSVKAQITDTSEQGLIVTETQADAESNVEIGAALKHYEQTLKNLVAQQGRAYLFAVYKGKLSEGADFANNLIKSVICISIPLEYPGLFHQRLETLYQEKFAAVAETSGEDAAAKAREYAQDRLSLSLVLQACGRGIRSPQDKCAFVLLDSRYHKYGWRRFLEPRPYQLLKPVNTVKDFHQTYRPGNKQNWDKALVRQ